MQQLHIRAIFQDTEEDAMSKKILRIAGLGFLTLAITMLPLLSACGGDAEPTTPPTTAPTTAPTTPAVEKPDSVKIAYLADLTGPYAAVGGPMLKGFVDYTEMLNQKGGIDGVSVEALYADTQAKADLTVSAYKRLKQEGIIAVSCMVTPVALAVQTMLNEDKMPGINQSATLSLYIPPTDYMWCHGMISCDNDLAILYWFDKELWPDSAGQWTLGILAHDNSFALGGVSAMYKFADTHNVKLLQPEVVALGTLDYSANIQRLVDGGADVIFCETLGASTGTVLKQMGELGVLGTIDEAAAGDGKIVPFLGCTSYYAEQLLAAHDEAAYVYGGLPYYLDYEEDNAGVKEVNDFMRAKYGKIVPGSEGGSSYREAWNNAMVICSAIERAVNEVGWDGLTGEAIVEYGLKGLEISDDRCFVVGKMSYNDYAGDRIGAQSFRMGAWDMDRWDRTSISPIIDVPKLMPELRVTDYMTTQGGPGWYTP
jgi:ABC-type branched-subunit amino acid transport system substrate-binding protein